MSYKLSKTELAVGDMYFRQGMKPREIADKLNISVNTVYKAISKYKAIYGDQPQGPPAEEPRQAQEDKGEAPTPYRVTFTVTTQYPQALHVVQEKCDDQLQVELLLKLASSLNDLANKVNELAKKIEGLAGGQQPQRPPPSAEMEAAPDFIRDNVWIDVIRSKHSA